MLISFFSFLFRLHPPALPRPLGRAPNLALHLLVREAPPVRAGLCVVALRVPLLPAEPVLLVLLLPLEVAARTVSPAGLVVGAVELDVEEVFFVGGGYVGAGAF